MQRTLLSKAPLRSRMVTGVVVCFLWLALVQLLNLHVVWTTEGRSARTVAEDSTTQSQLAALASKAGQIQANLLTQWNAPSEEVAEQSRAASERLDQEIQSSAESLGGILRRPEERVALEDFRFAWSSYARSREGAAPTEGTVSIPQSVIEAGSTALGELQALLATAAGGAHVRLMQVNEQRARSRTTMLAMSFLATVPALLLGVYVVTELSRTTDALTKVAQLVAAGDTEWKVQTGTGDELETLGEALNHLIRNTKRTAAARREVSEQLEREMLDHRRTDAALAAERKRYESLLRLLGDAVVTTDTAGRVIGLNRSAERLTGWSHRDALGKPIEQIVQCAPDQLSLAGILPVSRVLASGVSTLRGDRMTLLTRGGTKRGVTRHSVPLHDADDRVIGTLVVFHELAPGEEGAR